MMVESGFSRVAGFTSLFSEVDNSGMVVEVVTAVVDVAEVEVVVDVAEVKVVVDDVEVEVADVEVEVADVEVVVAEVEVVSSTAEVVTSEDVVIGTLVDDVEVDEVEVVEVEVVEVDVVEVKVDEVEATMATLDDTTTSLPRINFMFSAKLFPLFTFDHAEAASQREIPPKYGLLIISLVKYFETVLGSA